MSSRAMTDLGRQNGGPDGSTIVDQPTTPFLRLVKGGVLVIEDEDILRDSLGPLLEDEGYAVSFAENGRQGLMRLYTEGLPDIIVLDLRMPVMNGWEFRTIQKDDPKLALIPVVAISADWSAQAMAISADAYLRKPVDAMKLLSTIAGVLSKPAAEPRKL